MVIGDPPYNVRVEPRSNNAIAAGLSSFEAMHRQKLDVSRHSEDRPELTCCQPNKCQLRPFREWEPVSLPRLFNNEGDVISHGSPGSRQHFDDQWRLVKHQVCLVSDGEDGSAAFPRVDCAHWAARRPSYYPGRGE